MSKPKRRRQRKNQNRKHDQTLEAKAKSAEANGIARTPAITPKVKSCPAQLEYERLLAIERAKRTATHYSHCNLQSLSLVFSDGTKTTEIPPLTRQRRSEPPQPSAKRYQNELAAYDLVVETLSISRNTTTHAGQTEYSTSPSNMKTPQHLTVTSKCGPRHSDHEPLHPTTMVSLALGSDPLESENGKPIGAFIELPRLSIINPGTWGRIWPFGGQKHYDVEVVGQACGNIASPGKSLTDLAVHVAAFPYEEWTVSLGLGAARGAKMARERNYAENNGGKGVGTKITYTSTKGVTVTENSTTHFADNEAIKSHKSQDATLSTFTETERERAPFRRKFGPEQPKDPQTEVGKLDIEWKVAGQETEIELAETINKLLNAAHLVHEVLQLFKDIQLGWSFSWDYSLFEGAFTMSWGHRWPTKVPYAELDRVYYIERFAGAGGEIKFIRAEVEGSFGIKYDKWYLKILAHLSLTLKVGVGVKGQFQKVWDNSTGTERSIDGNAGVYKLEPYSSITGELKLEGGVVVGGVGLIATAGMEGKIELTVDASFYVPTPGLEVSTSCHSDDIQAIVRTTTSWKSVSVWESDPLKLFNGRQWWTDKVLYGKEA